MPSDAKTDAQTELIGNADAGAASASYTITVQVSSQVAGASATLLVDGSVPPLLIGHGQACNLQIADAHVSRRHLSVDVSGAHLRVVDLDSKNGTFVNQLRVREALLVGGESIRIGETTLAVHRGPMSHPADSHAMRFGRMLGASPAMRRLYPLCTRLALANVPVVLEGETGTGKEQLAEALHEEGPRRDAPFVVFDCTAVPGNLLESALFGHARGAFTGAVSARKGAFEQAHGGTLLIDEIGELDIALQPKLLRALQRGQIQRVGESAWQNVNVRVLAATRRDLDREVQEGRFRDDLFFRLAVTRIALPPLRERAGDVELLARQFWKKLAEAGAPFPEHELPRLRTYAWPGNVRELYNTIARLAALGDLGALGAPGGLARGAEPEDVHAPDDLVTRDIIGEIVALSLPFPRARDLVTAELERRYIEHMLARHNGNVAKAAVASGIARRYFHIIKARSGG